MIIDKKSLVKLKDFGLNTYESKIWTALLSKGYSTAGELSDIANVPRSRSYDVLESLEKKGFVIMKPGKPIKYIAVPPKEVLERVKKKVSEKTKKEIKVIESLKTGSLVKELSALHEQGVSLGNLKEISGSLSGRKNLYSQLETMLRNAKSSVIMVTNTERFIEKTINFKQVFDSLSKRKVKLRVALSSDKNFKIEPETNKKIEIRKTDIKARFCIVDGKEILFMLFNDDKVHPSYDTGIWVVNSDLSKHIEELFNNDWKNMAVVE